MITGVGKMDEIGRGWMWMFGLFNMVDVWKGVGCLK